MPCTSDRSDESDNVSTPTCQCEPFSKVVVPRYFSTLTKKSITRATVRKLNYQYEASVVTRVAVNERNISLVARLQLNPAGINQRRQLLRIHLFVSRDEPTREREWVPAKSLSASPISKPNVTHVTSPVVHFTFSDPSVFSILNSASMHTIAHHSDASATCLPGLYALRQRLERSNQRWPTHTRSDARNRKPREPCHRSASHPPAGTALA